MKRRKPPTSGPSWGKRARRRGSGLAPVHLERNLLEKRGPDGRYHPWFPTAIEAPGAAAAGLRDLGFKVVIDSMRGDPAALRPAIERGALIMARLSGATAPDAPDRILEQMNSYPLRDSVAFWHLGSQLGRHRVIGARQEELTNVRAAISAVRNLDEPDSSLTLAGVDGELGLFARAPAGLDMIGIEPRFWGTSSQMLETYAYLNQRRSLTVRSNLGLLFWAWIPAYTRPDVIKNIWGDDTPPSWGVPPVQPTQLRQMTYLALASGHRGIAYQSDADLTRGAGAGRALAIEMSFLNFEIDVFGDILARNEQNIRDYGVYDPEPLPLPSNATQLNNRRPVQQKEQTPRQGMLASAITLPNYKGRWCWWGISPGILSSSRRNSRSTRSRSLLLCLKEAQGYAITPGGVTVLQRERVAVGTRMTIKEFDTTCIILCTSDLAAYDRLRLLVESVRPQAVALAIEQSEILLQAVSEANGRLAADGHEFRSKVDLKRRRQAGIEAAPPDVPDLLAQAQRNINDAREAMERQDYAEAWKQARRAQRPLRIVMNGHWLQAYDAFTRAAKKIYPLRPGEDEVDPDTDLKPKKKQEIPKIPRRPTLMLSPVSCPPSISFFTLPEHYIWVDWIKGQPGYRWGRNRIPSGDFDDSRAIAESGWVDISYQLEGLSAKVLVVPRAEPPPKTKAEQKKLPDSRTRGSRRRQGDQARSEG